MRIQKTAALSAALALAWLGLAGTDAAAQARGPEQSLVNRYCLTCHNDRALQGGLSLEAAPLADVAGHAEVWERVVRKLRAGAMPRQGRRVPMPTPTRGCSPTSRPRSTPAPTPPRTRGGRRRSGASTAPSTATPSATCSIWTSTWPPCCPATTRATASTTWGLVELSPTLMERYLSAAQRISRLAVGSSAIVPGSRVVILRPDLTQESHLAGLPFGTRGGVVVDHTFPLDGEYEIEVAAGPQPERERRGPARPPRGRDAPRRRAPEAVQRGPRPQPARRLLRRRGRRPAPQPAAAGRGRAAHGRRRLPAQERGPHRDRAAALPGAVQPGPSSAAAAGGALGVDRRDRSTRPGPATPRAATASSRAGRRRRPTRPTARPRSSRPWPGAPTGGRCPTATSRCPSRSTSGAAPTAASRRGIELALRALLASPEFLFRIEEDPDDAAPGAPYRLDDLALASRLSFFLWSSIPDDELLDSRRGRRAERPRGARGAGAAHALRPAGRSADQQLRRPVAAPPQPGDGGPEPAPLPRLRRQPAAGVPARDRAAVRQPRRRGPQRPRPPAGRLHVPQRAPRPALRHPRRLRQRVPARRPAARQPPRADCWGTAAS